MRAKLLNYFRSRDRGWVLSLFAAVCLLYLPFLGSPFIFDDLSFFFGGAAAKYAHAWFHFELRWLPYASLGWTEVAFSNVVTHFFHLGNMLLHAANAILLFYLLRVLAGTVTDAKENANVIVWGAWLGALIFALHPVAVYATGYVVERSILMATFFALIVQLSYLRSLITGQTRWLALAVAAYFMAVFSKEHSVLTPALLAAETIVLRGRIQLARPALWTGWAAFAAVGLLVALIARGVLGTPYEAMSAALFEQQGVVASASTQHGLSVLTQAGLFFKYLLLWLLPNPAWMSIDMREPFIASWASWQGWLGAAGFVAYGALGVWLLLRPRWAALAGLAMLYPWLQFLLEFSSVRVQEPFVLYRSYLWMPGLMLLIPLLFLQWPGRRTWLALAALLLLLAPAAANRLWVFADNYRLWNDAARLLPNDTVAGADRIYFNLGQAKIARGMRDEGIADFKRSLAISPQYAPVHFELGWQYAVVGRYDEAMAEFTEAIRLNPSHGGAYYGMGMIMKIRGDEKKAAGLMAKSCEMKFAMACLLSNRKIEHDQ